MPPESSGAPLILDDRRSGDLDTPLGTRWRAFSDTVMGGLSAGQLTLDRVAGRPCLRLTGQVRLENNGGFLQASLDLSPDGYLDARGHAGLELEVYGNGARYNLHLRSADTQRVWQSYRASFLAPPEWQLIRLPFDAFQPYRLDQPLDLGRLRRLGLVAIGQAMHADLCLARLALYD